MSRQILRPSKSSVYTCLKAENNHFFQRSNYLNIKFGFGAISEVYPKLIWARLETVKRFHIQSFKNRQEKLFKEFFDKKSIIQDAKYKDLQKKINSFHTCSSTNDLTKLFTSPKNTLDNYYSTVSKELNIKNVCQIKYLEDTSGKWQCTYEINWPEKKSFTLLGNNKKHASNQAAYKCLEWLHSLGKINEKGSPIIFDKFSLNECQKIEVQTNILHEIDTVVEEYNKSIKDIVCNELNQENDLQKKEHIQFNNSLINEFKINPLSRNKLLYRRLTERQKQPEKTYPILKYRNEIIKNLDLNQVFIIEGDTGCGKTTQVPQIIMDYFTMKHLASSCNILITEPRRLSAISISERIAEERNEKVGDVVGYNVRFSNKLPMYPGSIYCCTTGIFRNKLRTFPDLKDVSHVIIDEAHLRSIDVDIILLQLKRAMSLNPQLKVIIMSATINTKLFQEYFNCPVIHIPGKIYPVKEHFLEDIINLGISSTQNSFDAKNKSKSLVSNNKQVDCQLIANLIKYITLNKPPGAILCFLPSWNLIKTVKKLLESEYQTLKPIKLFLLHSKISNNDQKLIFTQVPEGTRKIILSTDIAETGITVPDVVYVVDSVMQNYVLWNDARKTSSMSHGLIAKANIHQRKGRAGRVQPGESYHLISRDDYEKLFDYPIPEMQRVSLEKVILDCKVLNETNVRDFLNQLIEPPSTSTINSAIYELVQMGAFTSEEELTHLGRHIAKFCEHPSLAKAVILARIFGCLEPMLSIAASFSMYSDIFLDSLTNKAQIRELKQKFQPFSDHLSYAKLTKKILSVFLNDFVDEKFDLNEIINFDNIKTLRYVLKSILTSLTECGMIKLDEYSEDSSNELNRYSKLDELVQGLLVASTDKILYRKKYCFRKGVIRNNSELIITEDNLKGLLSPETVNYKRKDWPSPYLTYYKKIHSEEMRGVVIRDSGMVSPLSVLLFSSGNVKKLKSKYKHNIKENNNYVDFTIDNKNNVKMCSDYRTFFSVLKFREMMWNVVHYFYKKQTPKVLEFDKDYLVVNEFKLKMLKVLSEALNETSINNFESESSNKSKEEDTHLRKDYEKLRS